MKINYSKSDIIQIKQAVRIKIQIYLKRFSRLNHLSKSGRVHVAGNRTCPQIRRSKWESGIEVILITGGGGLHISANGDGDGVLLQGLMIICMWVSRCFTSGGSINWGFCYFCFFTEIS